MRKVQRFSMLTIVALVTLLADCGQQSSNDKFKTSFCQAVENAYNKGDVNALDKYLSADFIRHDPPNPDIEGLEVFKQAIEASRKRSPDRHLTIDSMIMEGNQSASRWTYEATDPSSGKKIKITGSAMYQWVNGKAVECWHYGDYLGRYQQLGYKLTPPLTPNIFAQVTITQKNPEKIAESAKIYGESVVPEVKKQKGFRGCLLLDDFKTGKSISIVLWERKSDVRAVEQSGFYKNQIDKFKGMFTAPTVREGYNVTVQE